MREISSVRDYYIKAGWGLLLIITYIPRRCSVDGLEEGELEGQAGSGSRCPGWALVRSPGALLVAGSGVLGRIQGYRRASLVAMGMGWSVSSPIRAGQDKGSWYPEWTGSWGGCFVRSGWGQFMMPKTGPDAVA